MPLNYNDKKLFRVPIVTATGTINYIYASNVDLPAADATVLGVVAVDLAAIPAGSVYQCNSPKPPSVRRFEVARGWDSSFVAPANIGAARTAGWTKANRQISAGVIIAGGRTKTHYVEVGGVRYAWNLHMDRVTKIGAELAGLGIIAATQNDRPSLVWGSTAPRPAMASKIFTGAGGSDLVTVFVAQAKEDSLPAGWTITRPRIDIADILGGTQPVAP
ncbi:hypothetical protein [Microcoleus sp. FACHB-672]|uniref:hypothetical protein n=1 Tax=Microcoleus sp. FACHB-672 TaxID=2692825 RepID=UPI001687809D|nr:hypothetical protein [Microcoleus sp. FACHB-672]MBD2039713.1 hypothetical protein [Microcoleus sp. FACHB-672]